MCDYRGTERALRHWGRGVLTAQVAFLLSVLMGHYSGLYPPPFRLGFHTGRGCAVGITLNKHSNTRIPSRLSVYSVALLDVYSTQNPDYPPQQFEDNPTGVSDANIFR